MIRVIRKTLKPLLLRVNAWRFKCSEDDMLYFASQQLNYSACANRERIKQMELQKECERIATW
jgi:hypothetical protein